MSTSVLDLQAELQARLNATKAPVSKSRSIKLRKELVFELGDGKTHDGVLDLIVLDQRFFNAYYSKPYNPSQMVPPDCYAYGVDDETMGPSEQAKKPKHSDCKTCPMNQWGSGVPGGGNKGRKACRNTVRLVVVGADLSTDPMVLTLPPTSIIAYGRVVSELKNAGLLPMQRIIHVAFDKTSDFQKLKFQVGGENEKLAESLALAKSDDVIALLEREYED